MKILLFILVLLVTQNAHSNEESPELIIEKIQEDVYRHKSFKHVNGFGLVSSNGLIVVENGKAFIIDTPWSEGDTEKLVKWIDENKYQLIGSISTHSHEDRTAGIAWLNANSIKTYASALTNQILNEETQALATTSFEGPVYSINDVSIEAYYPGEGLSLIHI